MISVEMIRDGGSLSAEFRGDDGGRYILFMPLDQVDRGMLGKERLGYKQPVIIDCDPAKRPPNTDRVRYSALSGPATSITWADARTLVTAIEGLAKGLGKWSAEWLESMDYVAANDGSLPPNIERFMYVTRL